MMEKHIRFDWAIKKLLRNKANFGILEGFLSELLKEDIFIQEILESETNKKTAIDKFNRVDILVKNTKNQLILIEVQNEKEHDYFHRMNYSQAKVISERLYSGNKYDKVIKMYSVNIVYFDLGQGDDYIYIGETTFKGMHTHTDLELSSKQKELYKLEKPSSIFATYYLLKLNNFNDIAKDTLDEWIYFLKNSKIEDSFKAKGLDKAKELMRVDSLSIQERRVYENYIKAERIRQSEIDSAIADGKDEVRKELLPQIEEAKARETEERRLKEEERRLKEEAQNNLRSMIMLLKEMNMSNEQIAEKMNKTEQEIKDLIG